MLGEPSAAGKRPLDAYLDAPPGAWHHPGSTRFRHGGLRVPDAIVLRKVTKTFGPKVAVRDLDLVVPRGALYGFIGPNGAGKTTSIRIILSILFADRGDVEVLGHKSALDAKDKIGYL